MRGTSTKSTAIISPKDVGVLLQSELSDQLKLDM